MQRKTMFYQRFCQLSHLIIDVSTENNLTLMRFLALHGVIELTWCIKCLYLFRNLICMFCFHVFLKSK